MDSRFYVRLGFVGLVVLAAAYFLVPTFVYFSLPPDVRNDREAFEKALPKWAPKRRVNLGLDLQGGVHLVLGVDLDKAVKDKLVRRGEELRQYANEKKLAFSSIKADPAAGEVNVAFASEADAESFQKVAMAYWNDMKVAQSGTETKLVFADDYISNFRESAIEQALRTVRNRVDALGVAEPTIARRGESDLVVQLPGYKSPEQAKELLGRTAQLQFQIVADEEGRTVAASFKDLPPGFTVESDGGQSYVVSEDRKALERYLEGKAPEGTTWAVGRLERRDQLPGAKPVFRSWLLKSTVELTGDRLTDARPQLDQSMGGAGKPYVSLSFDKEGGNQFERLTGANIDKRLAIVLDGNVDSAPVIQSKISGGQAQITLGSAKNYNELLDEATQLSLVLRSGALPAPVTILEERTVGASLGPELIRKGSIAALVGLALVVLFMLVYYKVVGAIADVALILNGVLILAAMGVAGATLTLPGIAGFILTLGMAVDANVLINERIREELRDGKLPKTAVENGYGKAFWTIFDANVTTLIAGFVLMYYGTGPIRGFAVTLIIGLLASMFTAIVVTRLFVDALVSGKRAERLSI